MDVQGSETPEPGNAANGTAGADAPDAQPISPAQRLHRIENVLRTLLSQMAPVEGDRDGVARRHDLARLHGSLAQKIKTLQDEIETLRQEAPMEEADAEAIEEDGTPSLQARIDTMAQQVEAIEGFLFVQLDERLESFTRHMAAEASPDRFSTILLLVLALSGASLVLAAAGLFL